MRLCVFHQPDLAIGFTALQTRIQLSCMKRDSGTGPRYSAIIRMRQSSQLQMSIYILAALIVMTFPSPILWLTSITIRPSFWPHHERIRQHQRRRIFKNSSGPSARQQWKHDIGIVQRDARSHSLRPEPYKSPCYQPSNW